jgi:hypothetical protein
MQIARVKGNDHGRKFPMINLFPLEYGMRHPLNQHNIAFLVSRLSVATQNEATSVNFAALHFEMHRNLP